MFGIKNNSSYNTLAPEEINRFPRRHSPITKRTKIQHFVSLLHILLPSSSLSKCARTSFARFRKTPEEINRFPRRLSKVFVLRACSTQPRSHCAQQSPRFAQRVQSHFASLCSGAFTMAEAIIVMTILGIIATIMITNLKPSEFRDKALLTQAKKY